MGKIHRLAHHESETLCGHRITIVRDNFGMLEHAIFFRSGRRAQIAWTGHAFPELECNTCYHIWKRIKAEPHG